jgi:hypothetical protein
LALAVALSGGAAMAQKVDYLTGGIGLGEREALAARSKEFNLKVVAAAERSGDYLAEVRMKVIDARDAKVVLDTMMNGPWLFAQLPPGKYTLEATYAGKAVTKTVEVPEAGQREAYLYWTVAGQDVERSAKATPASAQTQPKQ